MVDWTASMQQTFEYYVVDPGTWKDVKRIDTVISCSISRDSEAETLGSATMDIVEPIGECYVRVYLIVVQDQNGVTITEKYPLGTFLVQSPSSSFNGKITSVSMDTYTPLLELKENQPPLGYALLKGENIMDAAYRLVREHARAPVVKSSSTTTLSTDFVSDPSEKWISFLSDLIANAKYTLGLDEMGRILFNPKQDTASLQPVWTYTDNNSSILYADITMNQDLYGVPNVVEVIYSRGSDCYHARAVNDDENSPISTVNRGREIVYRDTNPNLAGNPTEKEVQEYAQRLLRELSTLEYTVSYTHGYCPVRIGDCVRIDYERAGISGIKAKVVSQTIKCTPGCAVTEKAVFTTKLWG